MRRAFANGVLSSVTLIPDETVSLKKLKLKYKDATPSFYVILNVKDRNNSAKTIKKSIDRIMQTQKGVVRFCVDLKSMQNQEKNLQSSLQNKFLKEGIIKTRSVNGVAEELTSVALNSVYLDNENGLEDMLAIRNDWLNVARDINAASVELEKNNR
jgi:hypothetical protein